MADTRFKFKSGDYIKLKPTAYQAYHKSLIVSGTAPHNRGYGFEYILNVIGDEYRFYYEKLWVDENYDLMSTEEIVIMKLEGKI